MFVARFLFFLVFIGILRPLVVDFDVFVSLCQGLLISLLIDIFINKSRMLFDIFQEAFIVKSFVWFYIDVALDLCFADLVRVSKVQGIPFEHQVLALITTQQASWLEHWVNTPRKKTKKHTEYHEHHRNNTETSTITSPDRQTCGWCLRF